LPVNSHIVWNVNYEPGILFARGYKNEKEVIAEKVETTDEPASIKLIPDPSTIRANGEDISVITVQVTDNDGRLVPTANNEIIFSIKGPGKIIGVGNGDPSSHEPDKYIESVGQVKIENLKAKAIKIAENYTETNVDFDDSQWQQALDEQGNYNVKTQDGLKTFVIRGMFNIPGFNSETEVYLFPKSLGEEQAIYLNGKLITEKIKRDDPVQKYKIDNSILRKGKNVYAIIGTPLIPRFLYDNLNTDPGIIQVINPAEKWKRKVFCGLAQIIIQSVKEPGEIILTATSEKLMQGKLNVVAER
jgi:beta-galactosidase